MKSTSVLSLGYWFSAYSVGLLVHPYKSVRDVLRNRPFRWLLVAPFVYVILLWLVAAVGVRVGGALLQLLTGGTPQVLIYLFAFLFWWCLIFLLLWQVLLGYLGWRFRGVV
jgi:hypothetical protein